MIAFLDKAYHTSLFIPGSAMAHFQARRRAFIAGNSQRWSFIKEEKVAFG